MEKTESSEELKFDGVFSEEENSNFTTPIGKPTFISLDKLWMESEERKLIRNTKDPKWYSGFLWDK